MTAEELFLQRCNQLAELEQSENEIDLLDLGAILRQLLIDKSSLIDTVNANRLKITYRVGDFSEPADQHTVALVLADGLDPETRRPGLPSREMKRDQLLKHVVIYDRNERYTVFQVIDVAANVAGGVHLDPKRLKEGLADFSRRLRLGGIRQG